MTEYDVVIRGGTIFDGTGDEPSRGDVAVRGGVIAAIGRVDGLGREEIDARELIVTPGFVDIHTHYDGQITWGDRLTPSSVHGVTSVVMGNCGVGFAPCRPTEHDDLIRLMEGVEDIPGIVMAEGLPWNWETFPQYLDALDARSADIDFAAQVPHSPVRLYVMGARGAAREPATSSDIAAMAAIVREGVARGALGFSTSRTLLHRTRDGALTPTATAGEEELRAIARALGELGQGVLQMIDDFQDAVEGQATEFEMWRRIVAESGRPLSFNLTQRPGIPDKFRHLLTFLTEANAAGLPMRGQVCGRPVGLLFGLDLSFHPFLGCPAYQAVAHLPLAARIVELRRPQTRATILREVAEGPIASKSIPIPITAKHLESLFELGDPPEYSPAPEASLGARARTLGVSVHQLAFDLLLERDGSNILYFPTSNFVNGNLDPSFEMMSHERTVMGIADGGAHVGIICDASAPTHLLTYWTRDREGDRLGLAQAVRMLSYDTARTVALGDRGLLRPGAKADINVIDYERLALHAPRVVFDLPAGGRRLVQDADGYVATLVSGTVTYRNGTATGALPGRLIRGGRPGPTATEPVLSGTR